MVFDFRVKDSKEREKEDFCSFDTFCSTLGFLSEQFYGKYIGKELIVSGFIVSKQRETTVL